MSLRLAQLCWWWPGSRGRSFFWLGFSLARWLSRSINVSAHPACLVVILWCSSSFFCTEKTRQYITTQVVKSQSVFKLKVSCKQFSGGANRTDIMNLLFFIVMYIYSCKLQWTNYTPAVNGSGHPKMSVPIICWPTTTTVT
jgi:hypothetical protein